jgi:multidrug transporter EmrE-like cation transporter
MPSLIRVPLTDVLLFFAYTIASVAGLLIMKSRLPQAMAAWENALILTSPVMIVALGAILYITSFLIWIFILARYELSIAYPVCIGLALTCTALGASLLLGENIGLLRAIGIVLVFAGILLTMAS